jgi:hypothetical protein
VVHSSAGAGPEASGGRPQRLPLLYPAHAPRQAEATATRPREVSTQSTYIARVPQCLSPCPTWDPPPPLPQASVPPQNQRGRGHARLRVKGWGDPIQTNGKKPSTLSTL